MLGPPEHALAHSHLRSREPHAPQKIASPVTP
jgi:hypothetical protein